MARQGPHAPGVDARSVTADMVLLDHDRRHAGARQVQRGRAAVQATADEKKAEEFDAYISEPCR